MKKLLLMSLVALTLVSPVYAEEYIEGRVTFTNMEDLVNAQYTDAVERMNHTYNMLAEMIDKTGKAKLTNAQIAWQIYTEADCKFTTDYTRGEPLEKLVYRDCLTNMAEDRIAALEYQLQHNFTLDPTLALKHRKGSALAIKQPKK